jgi:hypothetical protein
LVKAAVCPLIHSLIHAAFYTAFNALFYPVVVALRPAHIGLSRCLLLRPRQLIVWPSAVFALCQRKAAKPKTCSDGKHNSGGFHWEAPSSE